MIRKDTLWKNGPAFFFDSELFAPSTDSFALGYFAHPKHSGCVCDLGCGTGLLGTLLLARDSSLQIHNVEIQKAALDLARKTFEDNGWQGEFVCGDFRDTNALPKAGSMDYAISNPPYFRAGSGISASDVSRQTAREETNCTLADICAAAQRALRFGGCFALVYKPERLTDLLGELRTHALEPKRLRFVQSRADVSPSLVLIEARRGGKPGLTIEPPLLIDSSEWDKVYFR